MKGQLIGQGKKMIKFYKNEAGEVMYLDDTYLESDKFVIERPAIEEDFASYQDEYAVFVAATAPGPVQPDPLAPAPVAEPAPTVSPDGVA